MEISLSMIDPLRTDLAAPAHGATERARDQGLRLPVGRPATPIPGTSLQTASPGLTGSAADQPGGRPHDPRETGFAEAAVSLTQIGLVGQAMMGTVLAHRPHAAIPALSSPVGEPRKVERLLAPWGLPMLPSDDGPEDRDEPGARGGEGAKDLPVQA